jgi:hypothetical protein
MAQKQKIDEAAQPWHKFELFPTPPWATRALFEVVLKRLPQAFVRGMRFWEPCAGLGHMSAVLAEYGSEVLATDIYQYPLAEGGDTSKYGIELEDFLNETWRFDFDWIFANPPFEPAAVFLDKALKSASYGVAFLLRAQWLSTSGRYNAIFSRKPPTFVAPFMERVPMVRGGWDPKASTATDYTWFVWLKDNGGGLVPPQTGYGDLDVLLIPPGCCERYTMPADARLANRYVPGFVPCGTLKRAGKNQSSLILEGYA